MVTRSGGLWTPTLLTLLHPDGFLTGLEEAETFHRDAISGSEEQRTSPKHPPPPPLWPLLCRHGNSSPTGGGGGGSQRGELI